MAEITHETIVYVDGSNIMRNVGRIDYSRLMKYLQNRYYREYSGKVVKVKVFTPVLVNSINTRKNFHEYLRSMGYEVHITDAFLNAISTRYKDNSDLQMGIEMMEDIRRETVKELVLMTGDRDFLFVIEKAIHAGKEVSVIGPARATCSEYRLMQGFREIESIKDIMLSDNLDYESFKQLDRMLA